jgi:hypothetical protein
MKVVIVCIAKLEHNYIEEFVRYHLLLGFDKIYLYDNEDVPVYKDLLRSFPDVIVTHLPKNNYRKGIQYIALESFMKYVVMKDKITHVAHIDIDEFIVLKKHTNIKKFIAQYIKDDCAGIGMNWRFFGSSGFTERSSLPVTMRFTKCEEKGNMHIKTLFDVKKVKCFNTCHDVTTHINYKIKTTHGKIIIGPFNKLIDMSVIQLNHYKSKTWEEFQYIRSRGRAGLPIQRQKEEDVLKSFMAYDINEVEDLHAHDFYKPVYQSIVRNIVKEILDKII